MTDVSHANRRIHTRHKTTIPGRLTLQGDCVRGVVENIGQGGVFFATGDLDFAAEEGSEVTLSLDCRRHGAAVAIERAGVVLRTERYFDGEAVVRALAVKFHELIDLDGVEFE
jgi:hypothetical protein